MDLLPEYEINPTYTLADDVHTFENDVQFERYYCPFSCEDISICSDLSG